MTVPQIDPWPPAPGPSDPGEVFDEKAFDFTAGMEPRRQQMNQVAQFVNDTVTQFAQDVDQAVDDATQTAVSARDAALASASAAAGYQGDAQEARDAAMALVGFAGNWSDLTGALAPPATVYHRGAYWRLLNNVADVSSIEPAPGSSSWVFVSSNSELKRQLLDEATLYADFEDGDYRLYEGVSAGVVRGKAFSDLFALIRPSNATGFGVKGLQTVPADTARFVYSPVSKKRQGLLLEEQRTNLLLWSEDLTQSNWLKLNASTTATEVSETGSNGAHYIPYSGTNFGAGVFRESIEIKPRLRRYVRYAGPTSSSGQTTIDQYFPVVVDLVTAEVVSGDGSLLSIERLEDGWLRLTTIQSYGVDPGGASRGRWQLATDAETFVYVGDDTQVAVSVRRQQHEKASSLSSYIKSEATQVTRAADNCSRVLGPELDHREFTLFGVFKVTGRNVDNTIFSVNNGTQNEQIDLRFVASATNQYIVRVRSGGSNIVSELGGGKSSGFDVCAIAYKGGVLHFALNGSCQSFPVSQQPDVLSQLELGLRTGSAPSDQILFKALAGIPRGLSVGELEAVTQPEVGA